MGKGIEMDEIIQIIRSRSTIDFISTVHDKATFRLFPFEDFSIIDYYILILLKKHRFTNHRSTAEADENGINFDLMVCPR